MHVRRSCKQSRGVKRACSRRTGGTGNRRVTMRCASRATRASVGSIDERETSGWWAATPRLEVKRRNNTVHCAGVGCLPQDDFVQPISSRYRHRPLNTIRHTQHIYVICRHGIHFLVNCHIKVKKHTATRALGQTHHTSRLLFPMFTRNCASISMVKIFTRRIFDSRYIYI